MQRPGPGKNLPCKGTKFLTAKMLGKNAVEVIIRSHETEPNLSYFVTCISCLGNRQQ